MSDWRLAEERLLELKDKSTARQFDWVNFAYDLQQELALKMLDYLDKDCPHRVMAGWAGEPDIALRKRRECPVCIEELRQEVMGDEVGEG